MLNLSIKTRPNKSICSLVMLSLMLQSVPGIPMPWTNYFQKAYSEDLSVDKILEENNSEIGLETIQTQLFAGPVSATAYSSSSSFELSDYVIFTTHSVWLKQDAEILAGSIGVNDAGDPPFLSSASELTISQGVITPSGYDIKANRITVKNKSVVHSDLYYNELDNNGTINGTQHTPLSLPLFTTLPEFHTSTPGTETISLKKDETVVLPPGNYEDIVTKQNCVILFSGGIYNLRSLNAGADNKLIFQEPAEIRIAEKFETGQQTTIGPEDTTVLGALDIVFYVDGINGNTGDMGASPKSAKVGQGNVVQASFYVPNGTLWLEQDTEAEGTFIGRDIIVDHNVRVHLGEPSIPPNEPPVVDAGSNQTVDFAVPVQLSGSVTDDGMPPGGTLTVLWSQISGPYPALFDDPTQKETTIHFNAPGIYILRLTANDSELTGEDDIQVTVNEPTGNQIPTVDAGPDQDIGLIHTTTLEGIVSDDGFPYDKYLSTSWSKVSGPGYVSFREIGEPVTEVTFSESGTYVLRLSADDGEYSVYDDVTVVIHIENLPPEVNVGENRTITTVEAMLTGQVTDDGLPEGSPLTFQWSKVSGPGTVSFQSPNFSMTPVSFGSSGTYALRLTVDDSQFSGYDELTIEVIGNRPPVVEAGKDQTLKIAVPVSIDSMAIPEQPIPESDWMYDIGRPGLTNDGPGQTFVEQCGIDIEGNNVYVSGVFTHAGGIETGYVAKWDGCGWSAFFDPRPKYPEDPNSPPRGLVKIFPYYYDHVSVLNDTVYFFAVSIRGFEDVSNDCAVFWDGTGWNTFLERSVHLRLEHPACIHASSEGIYIGGVFSFDIVDSLVEGTQDPTLPHAYAIAKWDRTNWKMLGNGIVEVTQDTTWLCHSNVYTIATAPNGEVYAAGIIEMETPYGMIHHIAKWNGMEWKPVGNFVGNYPYQNVTRIYAIEFDSVGNIYVGGSFSSVDGIPANNIAKGTWNENSQTWVWSALGSGLYGNTPPGVYGSTYPHVSGIAFLDTSVYAVGRFNRSGNQNIKYIARWDGSEWHPLDDNVNCTTNNEIWSIESTATALYMGGWFTKAGGEPASYIVGWGYDQKKKVEDFDPILIENAPPEGAEVVITAQISQRCGDELTVTWNADGGQPEEIIILSAGTTSIPQEIGFTHDYTPGTHLVTLTVDDGQCVPIVQNTTVTVLSPAVTHLNGTVTDDGLPSGSTLSATWTQTEGPAPVAFDDVHAVQTTARFTEPGTYVLRLTSDDSQYTRFDEVTIQIQSIESNNIPPVVNAGPDKSIYQAEPAVFYGSATDDGLPTGILTTQWSQVSGPGTVTFNNPYGLQTSAYFSAGGTYVLRLTADDSEFFTTDDMVVYVSAVQNQPPVIELGEDQIVSLSARVPLTPTIEDDGLLYNILSCDWTGSMFTRFFRYNGVNYARFLLPGTHTITLSVTDGSYTVSDTITVVVTDEYLPPTAEITLPFDGDAVTSPLDILGTVKNITLGSYTLQYRKKDDSAWIPLATGNQPVLDGSLGQFDPTLLMNGLYEIQLVVTDSYGATYTDNVTVTVQGGLKVGNFTLSFVDLDIPVSGLPIQIVRSYDSRDKETHDFGAGWTLDIRNMTVQESSTFGTNWAGVVRGSFIPIYCIEPIRPHIVTVTASDGTVHQFEMTLSPNRQVVPPSVVTVGFTPRYGTTSSLTAIGNIDMLVNGSFPGMIELIDFQNSQIFDPDLYELTLRDGRKLQIDQIEGLELLTDRNDNTLEITENGIIHSSGKSVTFTRDTEGRIIQITDPMNNTIHYTYDTNGDLTEVTDQEDYTTTFTYGTNHYLTDITDPRGITPARQEYDENGRMTVMIDAEGNRIELTHAIGDRQEIVKDRLGNITVYEYDNQGNVTRKTDAEGNVWLYTYDTLGNKLSETDPDSNTRFWTYDSKGNMLTETDPLDATTTYTYNVNGQILTQTDPDSNVTSYNYDTDGNLISETDPAGNTIIRAYDGRGNLLSESDNLGPITSKTYDSNGNVTKETDPFGHETAFTYDGNGNQLTQTTTRTTSSGIETLTWTRTVDSKGNITSETDPDGKTTITEYNALGKKSAVIDKMGNRTEYLYDDRGNQTETLYPDGTTETATFDANSNRTSSTDRSGRTTTYEYDPQIDKIAKITFPTGGFINTDSDETGSVVAITDDKGNRTEYTYDPDGNLTKTTNALGDSTTYTYDIVGNQISMTDPNGNTVQYEYDGSGRKTKTIFPDGTFIETAYDWRDNKLSETDQAGNTTAFEYDALNRLINVTDALTHETTYTYDEVGNQLTQTDANLHTTSFEYDALGRMIKQTLPLGQSEFFTYDANGNQLTHTDFKGNTTTFDYDENNRLIQKTFQDNSEETYAYTATGRQDTVIDSRGLTVSLYDSGDRLTQVTHPDGSSIAYEYDSMGNRTAVVIGTKRTEYTYDTLNRLETITDPDGGVTTYTYDANGNRESITYPNGTVAEYTYDNQNRLTQLFNHKANGDTISCYTYSLGPAGNRTQVIEHTGRTVSYVYDDTYKLTEETIDDPDLGIRTISYTYDDVGNRLTKTDNGTTTTYTYDNNDRLLTENAITYTYDNNGNTLTKISPTENISYSYVYQNRLIEVDDGVSVVEYAYDTDGMRVQKVVDGDVTKFLLDKNRDYAQVLRETDQNGTIIVDYIYGDDLISQKRSSLTSYYHYDGQLSTRQLTDALANVTDGYTYDAFGILLNMFGATENDYLYTGEQYDPNVGFYYLRARYYNQSIGRFLTMDTWAGSIFEPASLHKYLYCEGNPINNLDPSGDMDIALGTPGVAINISISKILIYSSAIILGTAVGTLIETLRRNFRYRVYHVTTWDKFLEIRSTGEFIPSMESGWLYFSAGPYFFGRSAGRKLALPKKPDVCISIITYPLIDRLRPVWKEPHIIDRQPRFGPGRIGGGYEYWTDIAVPYYSRSPFWWPLLF